MAYTHTHITHTHRAAPMLPGCNAPQWLTESFRCMSLQELKDEWKAKGSPKSLQPGIKIANWEKYPPWPFQKLKNMQGKEVGIIGVSAPMVSINDYYTVRSAIHLQLQYSQAFNPHSASSLETLGWGSRGKLTLLILRCMFVCVYVVSSGAGGAGEFLAHEEHGAPHARDLVPTSTSPGRSRTPWTTDLSPRRVPPDRRLPPRRPYC